MIYIKKKNKQKKTPKTHWSVLEVRVPARAPERYSEGRLVKEPGIILPFTDNLHVTETKGLMEKSSPPCKNSS